MGRFLALLRGPASRSGAGLASAPHRLRAAALVAAVASAFSGLGALATTAAGAVPTIAGGLIAFRDARGIGVVNPQDGRSRMVLTMPLGCSSAAGGVGPVGLAGPVWSPPSGPDARLYFWLTDWQYKPTPACDLPAVANWVGPGEALLVQANPFSDALKLVAAAPNGLPCQPGQDLAALPGALAFTNGGCDEPQVEALALPLSPGSQPVGAPLAIPPGKFAPHCAIDGHLLGEGPDGRALFQEMGTQCSPPPPSLQWWAPHAQAVGIFSPQPPVSVSDELRASAWAPGGQWESFALSTGAAGTLNLKTGAWSAELLAHCTGTACEGATSVSFSPGGTQLAAAVDGELVVAPVPGGGRPKVLLTGGVASASWSGPISPEMPPGSAPTLAGSLGALWASLSKFWGEGERLTWRVDPAAMASPAVPVVSLPEPASALLMISDQVVLAAGTKSRETGSWWRSIDGGRTWTALNAHCAAMQAATPNFLPCQVSQMAVLPGGTALARGDPGLGLWRSTDEGLKWQRQPFKESLLKGGPWAAGAVAYLLVEAAGADGQPLPSATSLSLLASTDAGKTWHQVLTVPKASPADGAARLRRFFVLGPQHFAELYQAGDCSLPADLRVSTDSGRTWSELVPGPLLVPGALAQASPARLVLGASFCASAAPYYGQGLFTHGPGPSGPWAAAKLPAGYRDLYGLGPTSRFPASATAAQAFSVAALAFPGGPEGAAVGSASATITNASGDLAVNPTTMASEDLIFVTSDGGKSWRDESLPGSGLSVLSCAGPGHCLAASG